MPASRKTVAVSRTAPSGAVHGRQILLRRSFVVFIGLVLLGLACGLHQPENDDARFYVTAAQSYARWFDRAVLHFNAAAWTPRAIDAAFAHNHEHPPVAKYLMGLGWLLLHHATGWLDSLTACRVPIVVLWALAGVLLFALAWRYVSRAAAVFAVGAWATLPRVLFHAHAETLDLAIAAFYLLAVATAFWALERPSWWRAGLAMGAYALALGTKLNAPFLLVALLAYWLLIDPPRLRPRRIELAPLPGVLIGLAVVSPLVAGLLWPWLWFDTLARLATYVSFHLHHYGILFYYAGHLYGDVPAPWTAPWVLTALTVPVPVLLLAVVGAWRPLIAVLARLPGIARTDLEPLRALNEEPALRLGVMVLLAAVVQFMAVGLPNVPVYGGVKLFLPVMPLVVLLAAFGFGRLEAEVRRLWGGRHARRRVLAITTALLLAPGLVGVIGYHTGWLSYYNSLAGGGRGATAAGYERQYYDLAYPAMAAALRQALPRGGRVAVLPNPKEYVTYLARWRREGAVPAGLQLAPPERADVLVLTSERRWATYPELVARYRKRPVLTRFAIAGVPMFTVYDLRPRAVP